MLAASTTRNRLQLKKLFRHITVVAYLVSLFGTRLNHVSADFDQPQATDNKNQASSERSPDQSDNIESTLSTLEGRIKDTADPKLRLSLQLELTRLLLSEQRTSSARRVLITIRDDKSINHTTLLEVAGLLEKCGAIRDAVSCLSSLQSTTSDVRLRLRVSRQLAQLYVQSDQPQSAIEELRSLMDQLQPGSEQHLAVLAELTALWEQQSGPTQVADEFAALTQRYPDLAVLQAKAAQALSQSGDLKTAARYAEQAVKLDQHSIDNQLLHADILRKLGQRDQAIAIWDRIAVVNRDDLKVLQRMIDVFREAGETSHEHRWLARVCELKPQVSYRLRFARSLASNNQIDESLKQLRLCVEQEQSRSSRHEYRKELAKTLNHAGRLDHELTRLLAIDERNLSASERLEIAALEIQSGHPANIAEVAQRALPGAGSLADDWLFVSDDLLAEKQPAVALDVLRSWSKVSENRSGLDRLAGLLFDQQHLAESVPVYQKLVATSSSRQDELKHIEKLALIAKQMNNLNGHLKYLDDHRNPRKPLEFIVNRVISYNAAAAYDLATKELQAAPGSPEITKLTGESELSNRSELTRLAALAEQSELFTVAIHLQELLERLQPATRRTPPEQPRFTRPVRRSLQLRAQHSSAEELAEYLKNLPMNGEATEQCCDLIDELFRANRIAIAEQLLPTFAARPLTDPNLSLRRMTLCWLAGDHVTARTIHDRMLSDYLMQDDYSTSSVEFTPRDLEAVQSGLRFAAWLPEIDSSGQNSSRARPPFQEFPASSKERDYAVLAIAMKMARTQDDRIRLLTRLIQEQLLSDPSLAELPKSRRMIDLYLLARMGNEINALTPSLLILNHKPAVEALTRQAPQFVALIVSDWLRTVSRDPNAECSLLLPPLIALVDSGILDDETLWMPSRENFRWLVAGYSITGRDVPDCIKHQLNEPATNGSAAAESVTVESATDITFGNKTAWVTQSTTMAAALEQERQGNSAAACDLYLQVLQESREEFVIEFETLLQGFESARRETDLASAPLNGPLRDFSDVADAVLFLSVRVARQNTGQDTGMKLFQHLLDAFPEHRLRYLIVGHQSQILTDEEFVAGVASAIEAISVHSDQSIDATGCGFEGAELLASVSPALMEQLWSTSGLTKAFRQLAPAEIALVTQATSDLVSRHPHWQEGRSLLSLLQQSADSVNIETSGIPAIERPDAWSEVAFAAHLDILAQQLGRPQTLLPIRKQILRGICESPATSTSIKNWAALRLIDVLLELREFDTCLEILRAQRDQRISEITSRHATQTLILTEGERAALLQLADGFRNAGSQAESDALHNRLPESRL